MDTREFAIARQDDGWIYVIDGIRSAVFETRAEAVEAAEAASKARAERDAKSKGNLEEGLEETFPASDPVAAISISRAGKPNRKA